MSSLGSSFLEAKTDIRSQSNENLCSTRTMAELGTFDLDVLEELNAFLKRYPLAPGYGNDDDGTYYVGRYDPAHEYVEDWVSLDQAGEELEDGGEFLESWGKLANKELFRGELYALEHPGSFLVGKGFNTEIETVDRVVRCFRKDTARTVVEVLGQAYHILYDPENLATDTQGVLGKVTVKADVWINGTAFLVGDHIPTLVFERFDG